MYELARGLEVDYWPVYGTVKRLLRSQPVHIKRIVRKGRRADLVYPGRKD
ncbi:hypothetical protein GWM83_02845 [Candidatus Bathyarchaeota archaeon]|nr:hypothetical protein [Candidatus Bathyarchaeota archaeon]NIW16339.1 hypothetical protein [Candidatus Bathyarchaeota archaeon]NIW34483.1 hypothetical protein [Candidatus Bathyarchaeota archaeon]